MASFKLPRLKANLAIVDGQGRPLGYFLRLFNIELAERIETSITDLSEIQAQLAAQQTELADQLALIIAAQETADEALALAESAQGSRYIDFDGPYPTVSGIINGQSALSSLTFTGSADNATIDANTSWVGQVEFFESNGGPVLSLGVVPLTITSNGLDLGGKWQTDPAQFAYSTTGSLSGSVTYTVTVSYVSGANIVDVPAISVNLVTVPRAT